MSKLTKSSKGVDCIKCGAPGAYSCHYNGPRQHSYGKGWATKLNDLMTAELCHNCDQEFTEGSMLPRWNGNKWERSEEFMHWINLTNIRRLERGVIQIGNPVKGGISFNPDWDQVAILKEELAAKMKRISELEAQLKI